MAQFVLVYGIVFALFYFFIVVPQKKRLATLDPDTLSKRRRIIVTQVGVGILGIFVVRLFLFDTFDEIAWALFWASDKNVDYAAVYQSRTFLKCLAGFIVGMVLGGVVGKVTVQDD